MIWVGSIKEGRRACSLLPKAGRLVPSAPAWGLSET